MAMQVGRREPGFKPKRPLGRAAFRAAHAPPGGQCLPMAEGLPSGAMSDTVLLCYCTCPDDDRAQHIARTLVAERLAACVNRLRGVASTYRWQGEVVTEAEALLLIKTTVACFPALRERLLVLHPYELPELVAVPVERGHQAYLDWVQEAVGGPAADC
jgi:periplasmic divalent cation tolerance protein